MNEQPPMQPNNQPQQTPPQPVNPYAQPPASPPTPVTPGYMGQPVGPAPDPALYQSPSTQISSHMPKPPIWLYIVLGISFAATAGLVVAVFVLM